MCSWTKIPLDKHLLSLVQQPSLLVYLPTLHSTALPTAWMHALDWHTAVEILTVVCMLACVVDILRQLQAYTRSPQTPTDHTYLRRTIIYTIRKTLSSL